MSPPLKNIVNTMRNIAGLRNSTLRRESAYAPSAVRNTFNPVPTITMNSVFR